MPPQHGVRLYERTLVERMYSSAGTGTPLRLADGFGIRRPAGVARGVGGWMREIKRQPARADRAQTSLILRGHPPISSHLSGVLGLPIRQSTKPLPALRCDGRGDHHAASDDPPGNRLGHVASSDYNTLTQEDCEIEGVTRNAGFRAYHV